MVDSTDMPEWADCGHHPEWFDKACHHPKCKSSTWTTLVTDTEVLHAAATVIRARATAAQGDRPEWFTDVDGRGDRSIWARRDARDYSPEPILSEYGTRRTPGVFEHLASLTPAYMLLVADLFDTEAEGIESGNWRPCADRAIQAARTYLESVTT